MSLNLLHNIDDVRWNDISIDRSNCIDSLSELLETLIDEGDVCWHHPDFYSLNYEWGNVYDFVLQYDFEASKTITSGWMKLRHYKTMINLFRNFMRFQTEPHCSDFKSFDTKFHRKLNGILSCNSAIKHVASPDDRFDLQIQYCSEDNTLIDWKKSNHLLLPNIHYSNLYLAEKLGKKFDTDLKIKKKQVSQFSKEYCDTGYKVAWKGNAKEATADVLGTEVARRNFYKYDMNLSSSETQRRKSFRKIFSIEKEGETQYLSIDFEKGNAFEFCNSKGEHQGEFRYDGVENGKPGTTKDKSGKHDIWSLQ